MERLVVTTDDIGSVSYTHLDVYKRQPRSFSPKERMASIMVSGVG